jgi:periplasmic divalent cation tolerance protein
MAQPLTLCLTTEASESQAEALAQALVERGLAACVALTPVRSLYRWRGALERSQEVQLLIKTNPSRLAELEVAVQQLHSYDTPEWIHWPAAASAAYGAWVAEGCS